MLGKLGGEISADTLCDDIAEGDEGDVRKEWDINGEKLLLCLTVKK